MLLSLRLFSVLFAGTMLLLGLAGASGQRVLGATLIVTSTGDSGAGSLRQALADANNGDTIQFDAALNGQTITLTSAELAINKSITINGPGPSQLAVRGGFEIRIFHVMPGHTVTIRGLTISGGGAEGGGHGVRNIQSILTIDNCSVRDNRGDFSQNGGNGGGIYNYEGTLTITNSTIVHNSARAWGGFGDGGGIYSVGILEVANSTISENYAYQNGGGIVSSGSLQISNSTIKNNGAGLREGSVGGIMITGTGAISNSTISGNGANASYKGQGRGYGGGISNGGILTIINSTVSGNSATRSDGGILNYSALTITNSTISGNTAPFGGGGISNSGSNATLEIENTILKAGALGPNIFNSTGTVTSRGYNLCSDDGAGFLTATGDQINANPMLGPLQDNGGPTFTHGLLVASPAIDAGDPNFTPPPLYDQRGPGHTRVFNGQIDIGSFETQPTGTVLVVTTTVDNGAGSLREAIAAAQSGDTIQFAAALDGQTITLTSGGLVIDKRLTVIGPGASRLTVQRSTMTGTPAFRIFEILSGRVVTIQGLTISNGYAPGGSPPSGSGGGIYNSGMLTMMDCAFIGNRTDGVGGGIFNGSYGPILTMNNCTVNDNSAGSSGGGIYNDNGGVLTVTNCTLDGNSVIFGGAKGGGIYNASSLTMSNSTLNSNSAYDGGGIYNRAAIAPVTITNSTFSGNTANGRGGGIYDAAGMVLTHSTLSGNSAASGSGGGIYHQREVCCAAFEIGSTILKAGTPGTNITNNIGTVTSRGYNLSSDNGGGFLTATGDQVNTDPILGPLQDNGGPTSTHLPQTGSPAINAGDPNFTPPPLYDQRGYARVFSNRIDIGSLEVQPVPTPTPAPTPTATPLPTPTPSPTATPSPVPAQALNISTRLRVETGDRVIFGGFIITGNAPKKVAIRGIGPSLNNSGLSDVLADPTLELRDNNGALLIPNDNWQDDPAQAAQLTTLGLAPQNPSESGIVATLPHGLYTAVMAGKNQTSGIGLVEIYDADPAADSKLANISTRGFVRTADNVMIGGFILGNSSVAANVIVRGIGPSLNRFALTDVLDDPTLKLHDANGALLIANDNWQDDPAAAAQLAARGFALKHSLESGIFAPLPPGLFTAILAGNNGSTGLGLVEIYNVH